VGGFTEDLRQIWQNFPRGILLESFLIRSPSGYNTDLLKFSGFSPIDSLCFAL